MDSSYNLLTAAKKKRIDKEILRGPDKGPHGVWSQLASELCATNNISCCIICVTPLFPVQTLGQQP